MKKLLAITLALVLALSFNVTAFAAGSPTQEVTVDALPAESDRVEDAVVEIEEVTVEELPEESNRVGDVEVEDEDENQTENKAYVVSNKDLTEEQVEVVNTALQAVMVSEVVTETTVAADGTTVTVTKSAVMPVDSLTVVAEAPAVIVISAAENEIIYVVYPDGTISKMPVKDLVKRDDGRYEIPVDSSCVIVIATEV